MNFQYPIFANAIIEKHPPKKLRTACTHVHQMDFLIASSMGPYNNYIAIIALFSLL